MRIPHRLLARLNHVRHVHGVRVPLRGLTGLRLLDWHRSWKGELIADLLRDRPGCFVDIGVDVGQTLLDLRAVDAARRYIGIEANPASAAYVQGLIEANGWSDTAVIGVALGVEPGVLPLLRHVDEQTDSSASVLPGLRPRWKTRTTLVPSLPFSVVWSALGRPAIAAVKIDVEGAELEVLQGMEEVLAARVPFICEVLFTDPHASLDDSRLRNEAIVRLLGRHGYRVQRIVKSPGERRVERLEPITEFPLTYWTEANKELCDYLFTPGD